MSRDYINKIGCFNSFEEAYDSVFPGVDHDDIYAASLQDMAENYGIDTGNNFYMHVENFLPNEQGQLPNRIVRRINNIITTIGLEY